MGLREKILEAQDLRHEDIVMPEWGGVTLRIREMTAAQREAYGEDHRQNPDRSFTEGLARSIVACAIDPETNAPVFTLEDVPVLAERSLAVLQRLSDVAVRVSVITRKATEDVAKNS